jgi:hypothetical protein
MRAASETKTRLEANSDPPPSAHVVASQVGAVLSRAACRQGHRGSRVCEASAVDATQCLGAEPVQGLLAGLMQVS